MGIGPDPSAMEIRGERECRDCGTRWSYFETGSVACPDCGSVRSSSVGDAMVHTGGQADLDLTGPRTALDEAPLAEVAELAADAGHEYRRRTGFVDAGDLRPLTETDLLAAELESVGRALSRSMRPSDASEAHLLALLGGERPTPDEVPGDLTPERGLAVARAVADFRRDLRAFLDEPAGPVTGALSAVRAHGKRIEALDGDVEPREAERLVEATRDLFEYVANDDEAALARIDERLRE